MRYIRRTALLVFLLGSFVSSAFPRPRSEAAKCETPLISAIRARRNDEIRQLIKSGVDLNARVCQEGNTALFEALGSQPQIAKELILAGADANQPNAKGETPLFSASYYCLTDVTLLLLRKGANVNAASQDGSTPLMEASSRCTDGKLIAILLHFGASINTTDKLGQTALLTASFYGNEIGVFELVAAGARLDLETTQGETPISVAEARSTRTPSHDRIRDFLQIFGSDHHEPPQK